MSQQDPIDHIDAVEEVEEIEINEIPEIIIPLAVPESMHDTYIENYIAATKGSGHLMLFAGDQRIEHMNDDFVGDEVSSDDADPEHFFRIASGANIGAFATQIGLLSHYAMDYPEVDYIVKLNSKTNLAKGDTDPVSELLVDVSQVLEFKEQSGLNIRGIGYTIYLGSEFEEQMLVEASQAIMEAHRNGLITVLWIYPRGKNVKDPNAAHTIAGAVGVANALGADFVKVVYPGDENGKSAKEAAKEVITAAGRTKVIFSGGSSTDFEEFKKTLADQLEIGAGGNATGRNIHQKSLSDAIAACNEIYDMVVLHNNES